MPIRPENKALYPKNWKEIRAKILARANNRCEFCGCEKSTIYTYLSTRVLMEGGSVRLWIFRHYGILTDAIWETATKLLCPQG